MNQENIAEYVDADLRNLAGETEIAYLQSHKEQWRIELCVLKRKAEGQMTSYKARIFSLYVQHVSDKIDYTTYLAELDKERIWRTGANRFIQEIECKLSEIKS